VGVLVHRLSQWYRATVGEYTHPAMKVVKGGRSLLHIFLPDRGAIRFRLRLLSHESLHFWHCNFVLDFPAWPRWQALGKLALA